MLYIQKVNPLEHLESLGYELTDDFIANFYSEDSVVEGYAYIPYETAQHTTASTYQPEEMMALSTEFSFDFAPPLENAKPFVDPVVSDVITVALSGLLYAYLFNKLFQCVKRCIRPRLFLIAIAYLIGYSLYCMNDFGVFSKGPADFSNPSSEVAAIVTSMYFFLNLVPVVFSLCFAILTTFVEILIAIDSFVSGLMAPVRRYVISLKKRLFM